MKNMQLLIMEVAAVIVACLLTTSQGFSVSRSATATRSNSNNNNCVALLRCSRSRSSSSGSRLLNSKWDNLIDEDDEEDPYPISPDMKYIPRNIKRQNDNFSNIQQADGPVNDIYARVVSGTTDDRFWFVGKVARISDVTLEACVARQWPLLEYHAAALRPTELRVGATELLAAPGNSESDIANNRPGVAMKTMDRELSSDDAGSTGDVSTSIRNNMVGFQGDDGLRKNDGRFDVKPSEEELPEGIPSRDEFEAMIKSMDARYADELKKAQDDGLE